MINLLVFIWKAWAKHDRAKATLEEKLKKAKEECKAAEDESKTVSKKTNEAEEEKS